MKHLPWEHIGFLVCGLPERIPLKLLKGFEKNDEQFIILIIVFIDHCVSVFSREWGLEAACPAPTLFNEPDCRSTPLLYAAPGTQQKLTPFCPTDRS